MVDDMSTPDPTTPGITIQAAHASEFPVITDILVDTFADDPGFLRWIPQPDPGNRQLRGLFELQLQTRYLPANTVDIARDEAGDIVGVALWDAPDSDHSALDEARLLPRLLTLFGARTPQFLAHGVRSARMHPRFPHWYLYTIASIPQARGTGVGTALLTHGIARAGEEAIYLEATSTRSAHLYHRHGFIPLGYLPNQDELPSEFAMWRPPAMPR